MNNIMNVSRVESGNFQMRLQMTARNKLVIVRDADENLQIPLSKKMKVHLTQQMSDQVMIIVS